MRRVRRSTRFPYTTLFRSDPLCGALGIGAFTLVVAAGAAGSQIPAANLTPTAVFVLFWVAIPVLSALFGNVFRAFNPDRKSTRLNSSHQIISYAVFCLKRK